MSTHISQDRKSHEWITHCRELHQWYSPSGFFRLVGVINLWVNISPKLRQTRLPQGRVLPAFWRQETTWMICYVDILPKCSLFMYADLCKYDRLWDYSLKLHNSYIYKNTHLKTLTVISNSLQLLPRIILVLPKGQS